MFGFERQPDGSYAQTPNNAPAELQTILQANFGPSVTVFNSAIPGSTLPERLLGTGLYPQTLAAYLATSKAQIILGNWGINDANPGNNETAAQYQSNLVEFVTEVRAAGKTPVLEETNPVTTLDISAYVAAMDYVAAQMNVPLIKQYSYIMSLPNWQALFPDGVHGNDQAYAIKAQEEATVLIPLVKTLSGS